MTPKVSVVMSAHNPHLGRLRDSIQGLARQDLPIDCWEMLLVDNASTAFPKPDTYMDVSPGNLRLLVEPELGLAYGRICGLREARGDIVVLVDDDNVLDPAYLTNVIEIFEKSPGLGGAGGKSLPVFEIEPPSWVGEFYELLALRDLGAEVLVAQALRGSDESMDRYPACAPIGAGMALRRPAWEAWLASRDASSVITGRRGNTLASGEDCEIVLAAMRSGWAVGYFPQLTLRHLIPASRIDADYLARLNRGIQHSWIQLLAINNASPWPSLTPFGALLRKAKAWFYNRAWDGPARRIRWQGACGHFDGRVGTQKTRTQ